MVSVRGRGLAEGRSHGGYTGEDLRRRQREVGLWEDVLYFAAASKVGKGYARMMLVKIVSKGPTPALPELPLYI
jgi:hypothetical protein